MTAPLAALSSCQRTCRAVAGTCRAQPTRATSRRHRGSRSQLRRVTRSAARWPCHRSSAETTCPSLRAGRPQLEDGATGRRAKTLAISSGGRGGTPCTARQPATARCRRPSRHTPLDPPPRFARLASCPLGRQGQGVARRRATHPKAKATPSRTVTARRRTVTLSSAATSRHAS